MTLIDPAFQGVSAALGSGGTATDPVTVSAATYTLVGDTSQSGLDLRASSAEETFFGVFVNNASTATEMRFRVEGSMDGSAWWSVLAGFANASNLEVDVAGYTALVTSASGLLVTDQRFRLRFDERWTFWRLQALADLGTPSVVPYFRRA